MSLKGKLYLGFIAMIALAMIIGILGMVAFRITNENVDKTNAMVEYTSGYILPINFALNNLSSNVIEAGNSYYSYIYNQFEKDFQAGDRAYAACRKELQHIQGILDSAPPEMLPSTRQNAPKIDEQLRNLDKTTNELRAGVIESVKTRDENAATGLKTEELLVGAFKEAYESLNSAIGEDLSDKSKLDMLKRRLYRVTVLDELSAKLASARLSFWKGVGLFLDEETAAYRDAIKHLQDGVAIVKRYNTPENIQTESIRNTYTQIQAGFEQYAAATKKSLDMSLVLDNLGANTTQIYGQTNALAMETTKAVENVLNENMTTIRTGMNRIDSVVKWFSAAIIIAGVVALILGLLISTILIRNITGPINHIINTLKSGSNQINAAAGQIASASQSLAEGSTTQAASLEETSSALEQMASMTRQNADNAQKTNETTISNNKLVNEGVNAMSRMTSAMNDINDKSEKVSRIVKTIEDIAFQTNLLALNAAVEAARAGEAGKGFAVVADEVRNLSQRSAQAAKDTTELITGTVESVKNGSEIASQLTTSFSSIAEGSQKVGDLINQIAAATNEQAQGVDQVNTAVAQMDKVTQQNAANSEETASASEELSAQASTMVDSIGELVALVSGRQAGAEMRSGTSPAAARAAARVAASQWTGPAPKAPPSRQLSGPTVRPTSSGGGNAGGKAKVATVSPSDVIPMDDGSFDDF